MATPIYWLKAIPDGPKPVHVTALLSQPALAQNQVTGEYAFVILAETEEGVIALSMSREVADQLAHCIECGHIPNPSPPVNEAHGE